MLDIDKQINANKHITLIFIDRIATEIGDNPGASQCRLTVINRIVMRCRQRLRRNSLAAVNVVVAA